jgi:hypothetical protein
MTARQRWILAWRRAREGKRLPRPLDQQAHTLLVERQFAKTMSGFPECATK